MANNTSLQTKQIQQTLINCTSQKCLKHFVYLILCNKHFTMWLNTNPFVEWVSRSSIDLNHNWTKQACMLLSITHAVLSPPISRVLVRVIGRLLSLQTSFSSLSSLSGSLCKMHAIDFFFCFKNSHKHRDQQLETAFKLSQQTARRADTYCKEISACRTAMSSHSGLLIARSCKFTKFRFGIFDLPGWQNDLG